MPILGGMKGDKQKKAVGCVESSMSEKLPVPGKPYMYVIFPSILQPLIQPTVLVFSLSYIGGLDSLFTFIKNQKASDTKWGMYVCWYGKSVLNVFGGCFLNFFVYYLL